LRLPQRTPRLAGYTRLMTRQRAAVRPALAIAAGLATLLAGYLL
jgi:hypothetical protein